MPFSSRSLCVLFLLVVVLECHIQSQNDVISEEHHPHHRSHATHRRRVPVCVNGRPVDGRCECEQDYVGRHCEKSKHCATFRRYRNGSCPTCLPGYSGEFCEDIQCVHGKVDVFGVSCVCEQPYNGTFCSDLNTNQVYGFYNRKVYFLGPLGALSLIPMCALYMGCEYMAKKRQVKRVGAMLGGQNITIKNQTLKHLLRTTAEQPAVHV